MVRLVGQCGTCAPNLAQAAQKVSPDVGAPSLDKKAEHGVSMMHEHVVSLGQGMSGVWFPLSIDWQKVSKKKQVSLLTTDQAGRRTCPWIPWFVPVPLCTQGPKAIC